MRNGIDETSVALLRRLLGHGPSMIYGTAFLVEPELVCALRFAFYCGRGGDMNELVTIASIREETRVDCLDWGRFEVGFGTSLAAALGGTGQLYGDVSMFRVSGVATVRRIRVRAAYVQGDVEEVSYDALIAFDLSDGRTISFGHAPRTEEGACMTLGTPVTLANPTDLHDRLVLE